MLKYRPFPPKQNATKKLIWENSTSSFGPTSSFGKRFVCKMGLKHNKYESYVLLSSGKQDSEYTSTYHWTFSATDAYYYHQTD